MPTISLRLTEEEHEALREWAHDGRRSIQKEIIWRLFTVEGGQAAKIGPATEEPREGIDVPADGTMHALDERPAAFPGGRTKGGPDFKRKPGSEREVEAGRGPSPASRSGDVKTGFK